MTNNTEQRVHIAIFASGAGSNALKIIEHFKNDTTIEVTLIVHNKEKIGVVDIARTHNIPTLYIERERFFKEDAYLPILNTYKIDFIILAGFLWKIPTKLIHAFPHKIINIHPALLPNYGGKGMYGMHVHNAVIANKESQSGITIHLVDELYDNGEHLFQSVCNITPEDSPESLAEKIHVLEHQYFPMVIDQYINTYLANNK